MKVFSRYEGGKGEVNCLPSSARIDAPVVYALKSENLNLNLNQSAKESMGWQVQKRKKKTVDTVLCRMEKKK